MLLRTKYQCLYLYVVQETKKKYIFLRLVNNIVFALRVIQSERIILSNLSRNYFILVY